MKEQSVEGDQSGPNKLVYMRTDVLKRSVGGQHSVVWLEQ